MTKKEVNEILKKRITYYQDSVKKEGNFLKKMKTLLREIPELLEYLTDSFKSYLEFSVTSEEDLHKVRALLRKAVGFWDDKISGKDFLDFNKTYVFRFSKLIEGGIIYIKLNLKATDENKEVIEKYLDGCVLVEHKDHIEEHDETSMRIVCPV